MHVKISSPLFRQMDLTNNSIKIHHAINSNKNLLNIIDDDGHKPNTTKCFTQTCLFYKLTEQQVETLSIISNLSKKEMLYYSKRFQAYCVYRSDCINYEAFWNCLRDLGYPLAKYNWGYFHKKIFEYCCTIHTGYITLIEFILCISIVRKRSSIDFYEFIFDSIFISCNHDDIITCIYQLGNDTLQESLHSFKYFLYLWDNVNFETQSYYNFIDILFGWND